MKTTFFPFFLPDPEWAVTQTMKSFKEDLRKQAEEKTDGEKHDLLELIKKRAKKIKSQQDDLFELTRKVDIENQSE